MLCNSYLAFLILLLLLHFYCCCFCCQDFFNTAATITTAFSAVMAIVAMDSLVIAIAGLPLVANTAAATVRTIVAACSCS